MHEPIRSKVVVIVAGTAGLVFGALALYEYGFWDYEQTGPDSSHYGTTVAGDEWLRLFITSPLYTSAAYVLGPAPWLISAIYGSVTAAAAAIGYVVSKRKMFRKRTCSVISVGSATLAAIVLSIVFKVIWDVFILNPPS